MEEPQDATDTLLAVPPILRHLHPFHVMGRCHVCVEGILIDKDLMQADRAGIGGVGEHLIAHAARLVVALTGVEGNIPHESVEVLRLDLVDAEDDVHALLSQTGASVAGRRVTQ